MSVDRFGFTDDSDYGDETAELLHNPDLRTPDMYCRHGTFIGPAGGADLMCGKCESGWDDVAEEHEVTVEVSYTATYNATSLDHAQDLAWGDMVDAAIRADSDAFAFKVTADFALFNKE